MTAEPSFPGWRVVAGAFLVLSTTSGLGFYGLAVYLNALSRERGWDVAGISLATTVFFVASGLTGVVVARLITRVDLRIVLCAGGAAGALSLAGLGRVNATWQLYLLYALFGAGFSAAGLMPLTTVVTRWFHARRSVALSVASTGLSAGGVLLTPAAKWLLDERGLRSGTPVLAFVFLVGTVPFALWLIKPDPARLGWLPDGVRSRGETPPPPTGVPYAEAVRTRFFVLGAIGYVLAMGSQVGGLQQLVKLAEERTTAGAAALATLVLALASFTARLIAGQLVSRVPMVAFTVALFVGQGIALAWLAAADTAAALFPAVVLFGITVGNILMLQPLLLAERFGVRDYPRLYSRAQLTNTIGVAGGPYLFGLIHDHAGGYTAAYLVGAVCAVGGAIALVGGGSVRPGRGPA